MLRPEEASRSAGGIRRQNTPLFHHHRPVCRWKDVLQAVLRDEDRSPQLQVDFPHRIQEIRRSNGIQLAGGFVQDQHLRLHGHDRSQIEQLLLPAGEAVHIPVEPILDAKIACHFRHPGPHGFLIAAQALQAKGQLMPDLVRHNLFIRILHHIANPGSLLLLGNLLQRRPAKENPAASLAMGRQHRFQVPQEGGLATATSAAEHHILPWLDGQTDLGQRRPSLGRGISKS